MLLWVILTGVTFLIVLVEDIIMKQNKKLNRLLNSLPENFEFYFLKIRKKLFEGWCWWLTYTVVMNTHHSCFVQ